jgi:hypothetical protein
VRVAIRVFGFEPNQAKQLGYSIAPTASIANAMDEKRFLDNPADGHTWVERRIWVLKDDLNIPPEPAQTIRAQRE